MKTKVFFQYNLKTYLNQYGSNNTLQRKPISIR